jgi:hypothetical protein
MRKVHENREEMKLKGTHQLVGYADDVNLLKDNIYTKIKQYKLQLMLVSKMLLSRHQNAGKNHNIKTANRASENIAKLRFLEKAATYHKLIHEEIKRILIRVMLATVKFRNSCLLV